MTQLKAHKRRMILLVDIQHYFLIEVVVRILSESFGPRQHSQQLPTGCHSFAGERLVIRWGIAPSLAKDYRGQVDQKGAH